MPPPNTQQPYPVGFQRKDFPELMGWAEVVRISDRTDTTVRALRGAFPKEFPVPVAVLTTTPVYLADEVREFFANHPRIRTRIDDDMIRQIQGLADGGTSQRAIAAALEINVNTVNKYVNQQRI
jgi:hypothetical protein